MKMRKFVLMITSFILLSACSSTQFPTIPESSFEPAPQADVQKAKIAVFSTCDEGTFDSIEKKINDALAAAGQNVEFNVQYIQNQSAQHSNDVILDKIKLELSAGNPSADAYPFDFIKSGQLFDTGLTMDMTELVSQNAPVYLSKYRNLFPQRLTGIPTYIYSRPVWSKVALMLRRDIASSGSGVSTMEDLFGFIDETIVKTNKPYVVLAYETDLVMQWALEKGYYFLGNFGINGMLLCRMDDASFTPVPLEDIPGFADFITSMKELRQKGAITYPIDPPTDRECIGYVYDLSNFYITSPYLNVSFAEGNFSAQLFSPDKPGYFTDPVYIDELVLPKLCPASKAAEIVRFVEWMYGSQDNYDSIIYGAKGIDFIDEAGGYVPLLAGKSVTGASYEQLEDLFVAWPGVDCLSNSDYYRLPSFVPDKVEDLVADGIEQNSRYLLARQIVMNKSTIDKFADIGEEMQAVITQRANILNNLIQGDPAAFTKETLASDLQSLANLKNKWLCEQYKALIHGIVNGGK